MTVNFDVWGAPETWVDGSASEQKAGIKFFATDRETYRKAWNNDFLQWNTINYPTFWGIGKGSIWAQPHFMWAWCPNGDTTEYSTDARKVYEPHDITTVFSNGGTTSTTSISYTRRWKYLDGEHQTSVYPLSISASHKIWALFDYSKIVAIPYIRCCATTNTNGTTNIYTLYDYFTNNRYTQYPEILGISYKVRYGDGINENRASEVSTAALLINHDFEGSNIKYNDVPYFASVDGMDLLLESEYQSNGGQTPCGIKRADQTSDATVGDSDTGFRFKYCVGTSSTIQLYYYDDSNTLWKIAHKQRVSSNKVLWCYYPYVECTSQNADDVRAYFMSQIAFLGLPFIVDPDKGARGQIGETGVYLPKFDNKGVTTGEYLDGAESLTLPNSQWTDGRESGYDPNAGEDDGDTGNLNNFPTYQNRYANSNAVYALDESNFIKFVGDVNNLYLNDADDTQMKLDFKGSNPNDYIIGVYGVPFLCNYIVPSGGDTSINLGPVALPNAQGKKVDTSTTLMRDCGAVTIPAKGNFLDYEPYTQIELYIPMCGTIQLDCAQVVGRTLHVIVYYDVTTMACVGCVYRDAVGGETLIHTINGTIGASLPLTSARMGDYQNSVQTTKNALKQNEMRTALGVGGAVIGIAGAALAPETGGLSLALAGAAIGGLATAAGGAMTAKDLQYDLTHKQPALSQCSAADGMTAQLVSDLRPWLFIKRAKELPSYDAETYGKTVGFACCINSTVGAFSGYTVYSNVDLSGIPATKTEIDIIRSKLNSGVYI